MPYACIQPEMYVAIFIKLSIEISPTVLQPIVLLYVWQQIKSALHSVDYLNEYENILRMKFSATGRSILDFNGEH